jgi:Na+/melibiose symporter-like transporter
MGAALRRIQLGNALSAFGNGFTVPYLFVYVAQVRGLGAGTAGVVLSAFAVAALAVLPFTGRTIDRRRLSGRWGSGWRRPRRWRWPRLR